MHAPAAEVSRLFDATVATVEALGDDASTLTAGSRSPEEFALYIGMSGIEFEVLEGEEVRQALVDMAQRLLRAAA